ncbi:hypothetical protein M0805_004541 [Coniferiporia weirii]|nr:hypothetical protein M0805_004541 [Coniferiporia weirii]
MEHGDELSQLYDKLNLTGRVYRLGTDPAGHGGFADIWEGLLVEQSEAPATDMGSDNNDGQRVAIKVLKEYGNSTAIMTLRKRLVREVRAWSKLHHRNILKLLGFVYGFDGRGRLASLVSPWMVNGTAKLYLKDRETPERIRVLTNVADGLCYLHKHEVIHGDLKGDNILIDEHFEPRLADFGLSKLLTEASDTATATGTAELLGSARWMARELFLDSPGVTVESDIWAFGMTLFELFTGLVPFHYLRNQQIILHLYKGGLPERPEDCANLDDNLWELCNACWEENPKLRPSMSVLTKRLWGLDLNCRLGSKRRRENVSPERTRSDGKRASMSPEGRVRKSPKYSVLAELAEETGSSPGTSHVSRALVRTPTPQSATSSAGSASDYPPSSSSGSRRSSGNDFTGGVDPRRLFAGKRANRDIYDRLYHHHTSGQEARPARTYSEPAIQDTYARYVPEASGLGLDTGAPAHSNALDLEVSTALTSPRRGEFNPVDTFPRHPPGFAYQQQQQQLYAHPYNGNGNGLFSASLDSLTQYFDPHSAYHPSQWESLPYAMAPPRSSSSLYELQPGTAEYHEMLALQDQRISSSNSPFLPLPSTGNEGDPLLDYSPQEPFLSPHHIGPLFSEAFTSDYDEPQPLTSSPLLNESFSYSESSTAPSAGPRRSRSPKVDFTTFQNGVISPAFSAAETPVMAIRSLLDESPLIRDGDSFDADSFDPFDEEGSSLFGGFYVAETSPEIHTYGDTCESADADHTPHGSPQQLAFALPLYSRRPHGQALTSDKIAEQMQMPPTPRLSPLM